MEKVIKYAVVNILQDSVINNKFSYLDCFGNIGRGTPAKRWSNKEEAILMAKKMYKDHLHENGVYNNYAVLECTYKPMKRAEDKLLKQEIVFVANPAFIQ